MNISDTLLEPIFRDNTVEENITDNLVTPAQGDDLRQMASGATTIYLSGPRGHRFSILANIQINWLMPVAQQLQKLLNEDHNWDSYGGLPLNESVVNQTFSILKQFLKAKSDPPNLALTPSGGLQLEWRQKDVLLDIEVEPDLKMSYLLVNHTTGKEFENPEVCDINELAAPFRSLLHCQS